MVTLVPPRAAAARRHPRVPWSPRAWGQALYLTGGIPAQLAGPLVVAALVRLTHRWAFWSWPLWPLWLLGVAVVFLAVPLLTGIQRQRLRVTAGVEIPPQPAIPNRLSPSGIAAAARSRATWRQLGYHLLAAPALAAAAMAAFGMWLAGVLYALEYAYAWRLAPGSMLRRGTYPSPVNSLPRLLGLQVDVYLTLAGIVLLLAAPWVTAGVAALDARAAQALLGPSRAEELEHRVEHLAETRAGVVDAADAERRRLERDLHDGTQQRLVSLAMNLGMARAQTATVEEAHQAIAEAHEEAKAALTELRNLIRGLHPAVLEDRGLDAALSGVAARMPVPVRLTVDLPRRPAPVIEAVAYFVVSEGLANVAKHARASQAEVFVQRAGDRLHIIVSDDGVGGADPALGTGLAGLAKRASSVDGTFEVTSPPGGPTLLTVDLPCTR
ncbi:MAG: sensor domain-containing protein [Streptosporangiaceae bacterium]|nr:sensor domain-containing protein [Streptosporangiaceae bacterium]MBV9856008.1 sensor domain-containing protein [Streptosporangiaceae bacterium]